MLRVLDCVVYEHDLRLIAVSAMICVLGCCTTTTFLARCRESRGRQAVISLVTAAAIFGCSVWALHFVAMLAFIPGREMAYRIDLTAVSVFVACAGALLAFLIGLSPAPRPVRVALSGGLLGLAVCGMHYIGVAAMSFSGFVAFDRGGVGASVLASIACSTLAAACLDDLRRAWRRAVGAVSLAIAICALHFTAMAAMTLAPGAAHAGEGTIVGTAQLAIAVGGVITLILSAGMVAITIEQHLSRLAHRELNRMRLMSDLAQEVLIIHRDGVLCEVNDAGKRFFERPASQLIGRPLLSLFAPASHAALVRRDRCSPEDRRPEEMEVQTVGGTTAVVEISCQRIDHLGRPATVVALRDLTDRKRSEARIRHLARHDALTDLPNRYDLQERIEFALHRAERENGQVGVVYIDLDRFKPVNDDYGHAVGDELLIEVSRRIAAEIGAGDTLARIGGDEFVLVLTPEPQSGGCTALVARVLEGLQRPFAVDGRQIDIGASIGVALYPQDGALPGPLMRAADTAMYQVKDSGGGGICFFDAAMNAHLQVKLQLKRELAGAVQRRELVLHYQPIVSGVTGEVETFEALVRWAHPVRGMVPPLDFIPLAEETGLIGDIGNWVVEEACREAATWPQPWRVSVNVSPKQFRQTDLCGIVATALRLHGLAPERFVIEVTEGVLIDDASKAVAALQRLRALGVRVALDDFGTGYSSLSYLQLFKFDKFKIDKSFVRRLGESDDALTLTRSIVNLGHNLGLQVTAEGVETRSQLAILRALGCDQIQGYLVARPAPMGTFTDLDGLRTMALFRDEIAPASGAQGEGADARVDPRTTLIGARA